MVTKLILLMLLLIAASGYATAHCPLCTVGAGATAGLAAYLGVSKPVLGLFIGAFAVSIGWWFANNISKDYIPFQKPVIIISSFLSTVLPILPILREQKALYVGVIGSYGSLLNNTYSYNFSLLTALIGGMVVALSPVISRKIAEIRKEHIDYQGVIINFVLLIGLGVFIQLL